MIKFSDRVLVFTATQKDSSSTSSILSDVNVSSLSCENFAQLKSEIENGAGALLLAKEALSPESVEELSHMLNKQPTWSFLPVILLISAGDLTAQNDVTLKFLKPIRNATFLERPVRIGTLLSIVQGALADRRRQYAVRDLLKELVVSRQEAQSANEAKSAFLANMSHEIRTPLGAILGFSELMMDANLSERERQFYRNTVRRNGNLLLALVNDILDLAKVESGQFEVESLEISLKELVSEMVSVLAPKASGKSIELIINYDEPYTDIMKTDAVRLKQILMNVIGNAIKFTDQGSVTMKVKTSALADSLEQFSLSVEVIDTGLGITPGQAAKLFKPFTQADSSITRKFGGTGLGLILSKKRARALGGDLKLKSSKPGLGSTFEITALVGLPTKEQVEYFYNDHKIHLEESLAYPLRDLKVLVVDDSKDNQFLISYLLKTSGAEVEFADDGVFGVEKALSSMYDVVLMDVQMPRLGGLEATRRLRGMSYVTPIVALTANALKGDREKCLDAGCNAYLTKPIQKTELIKAVYEMSKRQ